MFIGIDFGTTNTVVARMRAGDAQPTLIRFGKDEMAPSAAAWDGQRLHFGKDALEQEAPLLGLKSLLRDHRGRSKPVVTFDDGRKLPLGEVLDGYFAWIRAAIAADLGERGIPVPDPIPVVLTVPQNCHDVQRRTTRAAALDAGFQVVDILNEPTAAALAIALMGVTTQVATGSHLCLYDFGGGTFDASLVRRDGEARFVEVDSEGVQKLGGADIDADLSEAVVEQLTGEAPVVQAKWRPEAVHLGRIRRLCEKAKIALANDAELEFFPISLAGVIGTRSPLAFLRKVQVEIGRDELVSAAAPRIRKTIAALRQMLDRNPAALGSLAAVVLTGGSSRLPGVQDGVRQLLDRFGLGPVRIVASDRSMHDVALGAAAYGALGSAGGARIIDRRAAMHVGVWRVAHGREWFHVLLSRGTPLPEDDFLKTEITYRPGHDVGEYRFCQCSELVDGAGGPVEAADLGDLRRRRDLLPSGDILDYPRPLRIAFAAALRHLDGDALDRLPITTCDPGVEVEEIWRFHPDGLVDIAIAVAGQVVPLTLDFANCHGSGAAG